MMKAHTAMPVVLEKDINSKGEGRSIRKWVKRNESVVSKKKDKRRVKRTSKH